MEFMGWVRVQVLLSCRRGKSVDDLRLDGVDGKFCTDEVVFAIRLILSDHLPVGQGMSNIDFLLAVIKWIA